ncbi:MAG: hypothetical protein QOF15_2107, partial [Mycobacterium sp.]|nr:hypothetical protein [Mycobacterium sp.]
NQRGPGGNGGGTGTRLGTDVGPTLGSDGGKTLDPGGGGGGVEDSCGYGGGGSSTRTVKTRPVIANAAAAPSASPAIPAPTTTPVECRPPAAGGRVVDLLVPLAVISFSKSLRSARRA